MKLPGGKYSRPRERTSASLPPSHSFAPLPPRVVPPKHPRGHSASARTHSFPPLPSPPRLLPSPPRLLPSHLACRCSLLSARTGCVRTDADARNIYIYIFFTYFILIFLVVVAGLKREKKIRFSIPKISKIPKIPKIPKLRGLRKRSREKKKVFSA
jgi:hypothetical protein